MKPLGLIDAQLALVMASAKRVPVKWRDCYLAAVADRLLPLTEVTDAAVVTAIAAILDKMLVAS